ncbi:hypothetical protein D3C75_1307610 [compost metagenome]
MKGAAPRTVHHHVLKHLLIQIQNQGTVHKFVVAVSSIGDGDQIPVKGFGVRDK